jgi:hypothetical protein
MVDATEANQVTSAAAFLLYPNPIPSIMRARSSNLTQQYGCLHDSLTYDSVFPPWSVRNDTFLDLADEYETLWFDTAVTVGEPVHDLIGTRDDEFPADRLRTYADRIMYGSDYPTVPVSVPYTDLIDATATLFPQNQDAIFSANAREFYGIEQLDVKLV